MTLPPPAACIAFDLRGRVASVEPATRDRGPLLRLELLGAAEEVAVLAALAALAAAGSGVGPGYEARGDCPCPMCRGRA